MDCGVRVWEGVLVNGECFCVRGDGEGVKGEVGDGVVWRKGCRDVDIGGVG